MYALKLRIAPQQTLTKQNLRLSPILESARLPLSTTSGVQEFSQSWYSNRRLKGQLINSKSLQQFCLIY